jgi:hypothetical protein
LQNLRLFNGLLTLTLTIGCFVTSPLSPTKLCSAVDINTDGVTDYLQCLDGCLLYDADGDAAQDDRACQNAETGCTKLDLNDDGVLDANGCPNPIGCSLVDADGDGETDDTFCIKIQGCAIIDVNSDGVIDEDNCLGCNQWEPFDFIVDNDVVSDCDGERFVFFHSSYQRFIGAILCTATRYKLVMSSSLETPFFNIGDGAGSGQDHCELVNPTFSIPVDDDITSGGCLTCSTGDSEGIEGGAGFVRNAFGEGFLFDDNWVPNYLTTLFYECGVELPLVDRSCSPKPACVALDRDGDGEIDTFDCSALNGCIGSDFNHDGIIDAAVCDPGQQP